MAPSEPSAVSAPTGRAPRGRILAAVCCANLMLLCGAFYFGATHRGEESYQGQELEFHHMRTTLSEHPQLEFRKVLPGVDLALQLLGVSPEEAEATIVKDQVVHLHTTSREALLNFSFKSYGEAVAVDGFYFTVFLSSQEVEVWNFTRFCWELTSEVEHLSKHGQGQEVLLQDLHQPTGEGFPGRSRAVTFFFHSAESFLVSVTKGTDDLSRGMDIFFSGQNLVGAMCEASGKLKDGMFVEIIRGEYRGYRGTVDISHGQFKVKLVNGTKLQVGEMYCRPLEENLHRLEHEWHEEHVHGRCEGLVDVQRTCSEDGCTVLLAPEEVTCEDFCQAHHMHCNKAWGSRKNSCGAGEAVPCAAKMQLRGEQLLCRCQNNSLSRLGQEVSLGAHVLLESRAAVVTTVPDEHGHLEVETPRLVTLNAPLFDVLHHHKKQQHHRPRQASCEELTQGEKVKFTDGKFKGHQGAIMSCDPVSHEYRVMLEESLRVHAIEVRVVRCDNLRSFGKSCSKDDCEVRPSSSSAESCEAFCQHHQLRCFRAWHASGADTCVHQGRAKGAKALPCEAEGGVRDKICECMPDEFEGGCFQKGVSFAPLNMPGQLRSQEGSALRCAQRCASVVGCAHFSYWTDGGCHLQDRHAKLEESQGLTSGPPDCLASNSNALAVFDDHRESQCEEGISYRPLDMQGELRSKEPSLADCALRCRKVKGCAHFSYWLDGGCHLQDHKASKRGSSGAISGPGSGCLSAAHPLQSTGAENAVESAAETPEVVSVALPGDGQLLSHRGSGHCASLVDVEHFCSVAHGSCKVNVHGMAGRSCFDYCQEQRSQCVFASVGRGCHGGEEVGCGTITGSHMMTCHCKDRGDLRHLPSSSVRSEFRCHSGDRMLWSSEKRWWCCRELKVGCESLNECRGDAKLWTQERKNFCCQEQGICQGLPSKPHSLMAVAPGSPTIPFLMQGFRASNEKTTDGPSQVHWLTRRGGLLVLSILSGVALLSLAPVLCGRCKDSKDERRRSLTKEGYLPVSTEET